MQSLSLTTSTNPFHSPLYFHLHSILLFLVFYLLTVENMLNIVSFTSLFLILLLPSVTGETRTRGETEQASTPPRGWNSYDSFCWTISEKEFLQNAQLVAQRLLPHGYKYVVVDYLWYRRKVKGAFVDSLGFDVIDQWGRMVPDPNRWPSSRNGKGFTQVAKKVHDMGLKFGIHVMRGISTQAVNANTPILDITTGKAYEESGRQWHAKDIGMKEKACVWMQNGFMSVNTKLGAGKAFLRSLHKQYAEWGVDFVKHDCVFGEDFNMDEISYVSEVLKEANHPILYSLSPGSSVTPAMAKGISGIVNMYRVTGDDWDKWNHVAAHFDISRDFSAANMVGAKGLGGKSWPDLDMLPLGWLTDEGSNDGPHRKCNLTLDEQRSQMTLWSIAKSPLMFGGDMRHLDDTTFNLISNPTLLEINSFSSNNMEFPYISSTTSSLVRDTDQHSVLETPVLSLSSCEDDKARAWFAQTIEGDLEHVCWKSNSSILLGRPFCLYKRSPLLFSNEDVTYNQHYDGRAHLLKTRKAAVCLGGSPNQKQASKELKRGSFSPCKWDANQMWKLNNDGTLRNSYSGLCASITTVKAKYGSSNGARAWIATGRKEEVYAALFNLDHEKALVSMKITDLTKMLPGRKYGSCKCREEWSGKDLGIMKGSISTEIESHGCAVFILNCT